MTVRSARSVGAVAVRLLVVLLVGLGLTGCGEDSSDSNAQDTDAPAATDAPTSTDAADGNDGTAKASAEFCEAAMPLFDLQTTALTEDELPAARTAASDALTRLASLSDGDAAKTLTELAKSAKGDGALFPPEVQPLLVGCAGETLDIVVSDSGVGEITSPIPAGVVAAAVSNKGETTAYVVSPLGEDEGVQDFLDDMEFGGDEPPAFYQTFAKDGAVGVFRLKAGRYAIGAFTSTGLDPNSEVPFPGADFVRIIDVE